MTLIISVVLIRMQHGTWGQVDISLEEKSVEPLDVDESACQPVQQRRRRSGPEGQHHLIRRRLASFIYPFPN